MKNTLLLLTLATALTQACAQEVLSREETKRYAELTHRDPKLLEKAPLKITADLDKAIAAREGEHAGMIVPDCGLTAEALGKIDKDVLPVGEIWLYRLGPMNDGRLIAEEKLNIITVKNDSDSAKVPLCVTGIRKKDDKLELLVYGKSKEPLLTLPLKAIDAKQQMPLEMEAEQGGNSGTVTLKILGKYKTSFEVTELELW